MQPGQDLTDLTARVLVGMRGVLWIWEQWLTEQERLPDILCLIGELENSRRPVMCGPSELAEAIEHSCYWKMACFIGFGLEPTMNMND